MQFESIIIEEHKLFNEIRERIQEEWNVFGIWEMPETTSKDYILKIITFVKNDK